MHAATLCKHENNSAEYVDIYVSQAVLTFCFIILRWKKSPGFMTEADDALADTMQWGYIHTVSTKTAPFLFFQ